MREKYESLSLVVLKDLAKARGLKGISTMKKGELIDRMLQEDEGLCVQIMHIGSVDNEPATVALMDTYLEQNGYVNDINKDRLHHEIYMSDARKVAPEKWKTVIRHPIKKA